MKALSLVAAALIIGCGHTQVQQPVEKPEVVAESSERVVVSPDFAKAKPLAERRNQCTDGVAAQYNIPSEPETAGPIIAGLLASDQLLAKQETRLLGFFFSPRDKPIAFCMVWDLRDPKGKPDYFSCRSAVFSFDQQSTIQRFPDKYVVDVDGQANGNMDQMHWFIDPNADGDVCNVVLVKQPSADKW